MTFNITQNGLRAELELPSCDELEQSRMMSPNCFPNVISNNYFPNVYIESLPKAMGAITTREQESVWVERRRHLCLAQREQLPPVALQYVQLCGLIPLLHFTKNGSALLYYCFLTDQHGRVITIQLVHLVINEIVW